MAFKARVLLKRPGHELPVDIGVKQVEPRPMVSVKLGYLLGPGVEADDTRFAGGVLNGPDSLTGGDIP